MSDVLDAADQVMIETIGKTLEGRTERQKAPPSVCLPGPSRGSMAFYRRPIASYLDNAGSDTCSLSISVGSWRPAGK